MVARTIVESPQARLRRELGLPERSSPSRVRVGDWMKMNCGDRVCRRDDPRHQGRVENIHNSALVRVTWEGNPPITEIAELSDLRRCTREELK